MTSAASIEYVQSVRGIVCPNIGFRQQLKEYNARYHKATTRAASSPSLLNFLKVGSLRRKYSGQKQSETAESDPWKALARVSCEEYFHVFSWILDENFAAVIAESNSHRPCNPKEGPLWGLGEDV